MSKWKQIRARPVPDLPPALVLRSRLQISSLSVHAAFNVDVNEDLITSVAAKVTSITSEVPPSSSKKQPTAVRQSHFTPPIGETAGNTESGSRPGQGGESEQVENSLLDANLHVVQAF